MENFIKKIKQSFSESATIPFGERLFKLNSQEFSGPLLHDYRTIERLLDDERVYSIVTLISSMCKDAYRGPELYPKDRYTDSELDDREQLVLRYADLACRDLKFQQKFFDYAWQLVTHGDLFEKITKSTKGITKLTSLPLNDVRVLENKEQRNRTGQGAQIQEENFISVKRTENDTDPILYSLENKEYFHISFKNHGVWKEDIVGSRTYGIYSKSPIASLQRLVAWKTKTIENDIIWKDKLLPKILFKLKMPGIVPSKYTGTQQEKVEAAKKQAGELTRSFVDSTKGLKPDDNIVITDAADASILEASSTNYQRPNETLGQINSLLNTPQGIPNGLLGGESGGSMGIELAAVFSGIRINYVVGLSSDALNEILKSHLRIVYPEYDKEISRLYIRADSSLTVEKFQKAKIALSLTASEVFTKNEIREAAGYPRLPQLPKDLFPVGGESQIKSSLAELEKDVKQEGANSEQNNTGPQGRRNRTEDSE